MDHHPIPTPRPWTQNYTDTLKVTGSGGLLLGSTEDLVDAIHIVKCVNLHDDLVEVLKRLAPAIKDRTEQSYIYGLLIQAAK